MALDLHFKSALVGATGLVGSTLLPKLLKEGSTLVMSRRPINEPLSPPHKNILTNFENLNQDFNFESLYYCFGTTQKAAGSKKNFHRIEIELGKNILNWARKSQAQNVYLVSSSGASSTSLFYYPQVKAELEDFCLNLGFARVFILRPSLLLGPRPHDFRWGEFAAQKILGGLKSYLPEKVRPITAEEVALAMIRLKDSRPGIYENDQLLELSK